MADSGPLLARLAGQVRKVAILRASRIGDFLCAIPAIHALRAALPSAEFTLIGMPFVHDLVDRSPYLDCFAAFPGFPGMADQFFDPRRALAFFARMQAEEFDLAVQMHGSGVYSNPCALLLGARATAGFVRPGDPQGRLDAAMAFPDNGHEANRLLALSTYLGAAPLGTATEFPLWQQDRDEAETLLSGTEEPLIGLHPAAREITKRWALNRFAAAGLALQERFGGTIVILGGRDERPLCEEVGQAVAAARRAGSGRGARPCLNLAGRTSIPGLGAVVNRLAVLVTNDSGPAHVAYALGTPAVTIFGATDPARWGPPQASHFRVVTNPLDCWPCDLHECPIGCQCLNGISVEQVVAAAGEVIRDGRVPENSYGT